MSSTLPEELDRIVRRALDRNASDVFLIPGEPPAMRIDGQVQRTEDDALTADEVRKLAEDAVGRDNAARVGPFLGAYRRWFGAPGEYNVSVSLARSHGDLTIALQIQPPRICTIEEVAAPQAVVEAASQPNGLIVVSGHAGSGKMTLAYALLEFLNTARDGLHICTVEGAFHLLIEPKRALVQQREVGVDAPDAVEAIRAAASQDLDVLFVSEIKDAGELEACINMADTGHLVIILTHASSPEEAVYRLSELFPDDVKPVSLKALSRVLLAVSAQVLLQKKTGGRVAAYGVLVPDDEMRGAIAEGRDVMARETPWLQGCQTIGGHIDELLETGVIANEEAQRARTLIHSPHTA